MRFHSVLIIAICSFFMALPRAYSADTLLESGDLNENKGDASLVCSWRIYSSSKLSYKIQLVGKVKKSGQTGSAKGSCFFVAIDEKGKTLIHITEGKTVGAKFPQGTNHKNFDSQVNVRREHFDKAVQWWGGKSLDTHTLWSKLEKKIKSEMKNLMKNTVGSVIPLNGEEIFRLK